jgi:thiol-disulfide isomerase/thioredoxin
VVVVAAAVLVSASLLGNGKTTSAGKLSPGEYTLPTGVLAAVQAVPTAKLLSAASSKSNYAVPAEALPARTKLLTTGGKPTVVFVGADYCPYCAAERWPLVMALSKFGSFSHLLGTSSSPTDIYPSTPTFSFYGSSYKSPYVDLVTAELATDRVDPSTGDYQVLQQPTALEQSLLNQWDKPPYTSEQGAIPFLYLAGRYVVIGAQYDASHISGWQMDRAAAYVTAGDNSTSLGAEAAAGYLVREICSLTHDRPANVCSLVTAGLKH